MAMTREEAKLVAQAARTEEIMKAITPIGQYEAEFNRRRDAKVPRVGTGYPELDRVLTGGLVNELYIMGAETSTGKSAFLMSIAQHIAASGIDVLYYSMEMGKEELVARGISSISYEHWNDKKDKPSDQQPKRFKVADVLYWKWDNILHDYTQVPRKDYASYSSEYFKDYGDHLHIIEGSIAGGLTVRDIVQTATAFKEKTQKTPVVFVDYLQIVHPDPDEGPDRKTRMDTIVTTLKGLASQVGMPVFAISSVGRMQYGQRVSKASFKESGDTEYTGGVLCGWNWLGVTDEKNPLAQLAEKAASKVRGYRKMRFEILKFRNSEIDSRVDFKYYPAWNYFVTEGSGFSDPDVKNPTPYKPKSRILKMVNPQKDDKKSKKGVKDAKDVKDPFEGKPVVKVPEK